MTSILIHLFQKFKNLDVYFVKSVKVTEKRLIILTKTKLSSFIQNIF